MYSFISIFLAENQRFEGRNRDSGSSRVCVHRWRPIPTPCCPRACAPPGHATRWPPPTRSIPRWRCASCSLATCTTMPCMRSYTTTWHYESVHPILNTHIHCRAIEPVFVVAQGTLHRSPSRSTTSLLGRSTRQSPLALTRWMLLIRMTAGLSARIRIIGRMIPFLALGFWV